MFERADEVKAGKCPARILGGTNIWLMGSCRFPRELFVFIQGTEVLETGIVFSWQVAQGSWICGFPLSWHLCYSPLIFVLAFLGS